MPDRELVLREKCPCGEGRTERHLTRRLPTAISNEGWCPGGSETVLDPERVLQIEDPEFGEISFIRVQDVLDALGGES